MPVVVGRRNIIYEISINILLSKHWTLISSKQYIFTVQLAMSGSYYVSSNDLNKQEI